MIYTMIFSINDATEYHLIYADDMKAAKQNAARVASIRKFSPSIKIRVKAGIVNPE